MDVVWLKIKRSAIVGVIGVLIVSMLELYLCREYKKTYGVFSPSSVSTVNMSWIAFENGLMKPEYTDNKEYAAFIENFDKSQLDYTITIKYGLSEVAKSVKLSQKDQPLSWAKTTMERCLTAMHEPFFMTATGGDSIINNVRHLAPTIKEVSIFLFIYAFVLLLLMIKYRRISDLSFIFWLAVVGHLVLSLVGAQYDWSRLQVPVTPLVLIMFFQTFNIVRIDTRDAVIN